MQSLGPDSRGIGQVMLAGWDEERRYQGGRRAEQTSGLTPEPHTETLLGLGLWDHGAGRVQETA